jgi:hypothetical protein
MDPSVLMWKLVEETLSTCKSTSGGWAFGFLSMCY